MKLKKGKSSYKQYKDVIIELVAFSRRPGIYIGQENVDSIFAFLNGIEFSTKRRLRFGDDLMKYIFTTYNENKKIQALKKNLNFFTLKQQVEVLSLESNETPVQIFKKEALNLLVYISDDVFDGLYRHGLVKKLKLYLKNNLDSKDEPFTTSLNGFPEDYVLKYLEEWSGKNISKKQIKLLRRIKDENSKRYLKWIKQKEGQIDDKTTLRKLSKKLLFELNRVN